MSKSSTVQLLEDLINEVDRRLGKAGKKSQSRADLDKEVISYSVHEDIIYKDISKKGSPFLAEHEYHGAARPSNSELKGIAKDIAEDMYNMYKKTAKKLVPADNYVAISNFVLPDDFVYPKGGKAAIGYDDNLKLILFNSPRQGTDNFESFQGLLKRKVETEIKKLPSGNNARIFISPSKEWVDKKNEAQAEAEKQYEAAYKSGSITEEDYKNDRKRKKNIESRKGRILKIYRESGLYNTYEGIQVGHTFGAAANAVAPLAENPHSLATQDIERLKLVDFGEFNSSKGVILTNIKKVIQNDTALDIEKVFNSRDARLRITLTVPENKFANQSSGGSTGTPISILKDAVANLKTSIDNIKGSPSFNEQLTELIETVFLGKKPKKFNKSTRVTKSQRSTVNIKRVGVKGAKPKLKLEKRENNKNRASKQAQTQSLNSLIAMLNNKLHDKIRENMGKGASKQKLNYRTGRFARSAKILDLRPSSEKSAIIADVKYMKNPYSVFEKGGRLNPPKLRDPAGIFGRSIRQILQEEKIATLRRVMVKLSG
jgi:hypothetical protein